MSKITSLHYLGMLISHLPDGPLKELIVRDQLKPLYIRGISPSNISDKIVFDFGFVSTTQEYVTMKVVWDLPNDDLTYHMSRRSGRRSSSRNRVMNDEAWLIECRTMLQSDFWDLDGSSRLSSVNKNLERQLDKLRQRFEPDDAP